MKERPTPETDAAEDKHGNGSVMHAHCHDSSHLSGDFADFARTLERQRDEAREELRLIDNEVAFDEAWSDGKTLHEAVRIIIAQRDELLAALERLLGQVNNIEVLGEWEATDTNSGLRRRVRPIVDAVIEQARAAIAAVKGGKL